VGEEEMRKRRWEGGWAVRERENRKWSCYRRVEPRGRRKEKEKRERAAGRKKERKERRKKEVRGREGKERRERERERSGWGKRENGKKDWVPCVIMGLVERGQCNLLLTNPVVTCGKLRFLFIKTPQ
jgi:hypothetical protein